MRKGVEILSIAFDEVDGARNRKSHESGSEAGLSEVDFREKASPGCKCVNFQDGHRAAMVALL